MSLDDRCYPLLFRRPLCRLPSVCLRCLYRPLSVFVARLLVVWPSPSVSVWPFIAIYLANHLSPYPSFHPSGHWSVLSCLLACHCSAAALAAILSVAAVFRSFSRLCLSGSFCMFPTALRRHSDRLSSLALTVFSALRPFVSVSLRLVRPVPSDRLFHPVRSFVFPHVFV